MHFNNGAETLARCYSKVKNSTNLQIEFFYYEEGASREKTDWCKIGPKLREVTYSCRDQKYAIITYKEIEDV